MKYYKWKDIKERIKSDYYICRGGMEMQIDATTTYLTWIDISFVKTFQDVIIMNSMTNIIN